MRHRHPDGHGRHHCAPADQSGSGGPHGRSGGRRPFDYGALRLLVLGMMADEPRHGYELIRAIEERTGGGYSPSPGVIYPTLAWLEDMGYAAPEPEAGGRKRFRITPEGEAFLDANRAALDALNSRLATPHGGRADAPEAVLAAMHRLKRALRRRFSGAALDEATVAAIAAAIETAAQTVEPTPMTETTAALRSRADVPTPKAASYLAQLCKHFAHKIPAEYEGNTGQITFGSGICRLTAEGEVLTMTVEAADAEALAQLQDVVARHLLRFAFREELTIDWQAA